MYVEDIIKAIPLGIFLAFLLGPVFFVLLETSALKGFRAAVSLDLGVIVGDVVFIAVAYWGTSAILEKLKDDPSLYIFGGFILCAYGVISFIKTKMISNIDITPEVPKLSKRTYAGLMVKGFLLNIINIGVLGFWLGLIVVFSPQMENDGFRLATFFGIVLATYFCVDLVKIVLAKKLNRYLTPFRIFWLQRAVAMLMFICGSVLIIKGAFPKEMERFDIIQEEQPSIDAELEGIPPIEERAKQ